MSEIKEIKPEVIKIAEVLRKSATVNAEKNTVEFDKNAFEESLPEGLDVKTIRAVEHHKQYFGLAQTLVTGELAVDHLAANKEAADVKSTVALPVGKSVAVISREVETRNIQDGTTKTRYGYASTRIVTKVPGSQMISVRARVAELAAKAGLGNK